ncbi:MAG TPA: DUF1571 domain-containing protein, partial [Isosphaeraceae bacterium]|nr:DUF1571 domain-containing protein [Isosphaeraceae bacterium]
MDAPRFSSRRARTSPENRESQVMTIEHVSAEPDQTVPTPDERTRPARTSHRARWIAAGILILIPLTLALASWALTPKLEPVSPDESQALAQPDAQLLQKAEQEVESLDWPETVLDGEPAKKLLLKSLLAARDRLEAVSGYTATMRRQERIDGKLGPEQTIALKIRHNPFAVYMRFLEPDAGKEVVYAEGRYDNDVMAHLGGLSRAFLPRLKVAPDSRLAMNGNRHPITEAGLLKLTDKLIWFRRLDLTDEEASTTLDRVTDANGREWLRSFHTHPHRNPDRPFMDIEILYDPET